MEFNVDDLLTGNLPPFIFQDAQEIPLEWPLSVNELIRMVQAREPMDMFEARFSFTTLVQSFNSRVAFRGVTDQAVRAIRSPADPDIAPALLREVQAAMVAPPPPYSAAPEMHDAYSHVLPAVDAGCRALLGDSISDPDKFVQDLTHIAHLNQLGSFRATLGVRNYVRAALPSILAYGQIPALGADFDFNGIALRNYQSLGAALLAAVKGEEI